MNPNWRTFLESAGAVFTAQSDELESFGDAPGELAAAGRQSVLVPLTHLALIEAGGDDAKPFLHSQLTSDINHLVPGQLQHSAWCSAKGRMQASFLVWRAGDAYRLALAADLRDAMLKRLQMFVLRSKVRLASLDEGMTLIGIAGGDAAALLAAAGLPVPGAELGVADGNGSRVIALDGKRFILETPTEAAAEIWAALSGAARPCGPATWRWLDVQAGFPLVTAATREEFVPQMADFEKIGGISFHKGCYPGQEVVARTQYLGKVKRHLYRVSSSTALAAGHDLHSPDNPDQACGKILSAAPSPVGGWVGLAVVQSNFAGSLHAGSREGPRVEAVAVNP